MEASIDSVNSERDAFLLKLRFISGEIRFTVNSDAFVSRALLSRLESGKGRGNRAGGYLGQVPMVKFDSKI